MLNVPVAVGVPVTAPVEAFKFRPATIVPLMENVYGGVPPVAVAGPLLNGTPTVPVAVPEQVSWTGGLMVMVQPVPVAPRESVTLIVNVPDAVGVPVTAPVALFRLRPSREPLPSENV